MKYRVISTDDHLQEGPDTWTSRMSKAKWGDKIPHVVRNDDGTDTWLINGEKNVGRMGIGAVNALMPDRRAAVRFDEVPPKAYTPSLRIKAMDEDGVDVHSFFANVSGAAGSTFSDPKHKEEEFRLECIQAYNDLQMEEYDQPYPGRFITLAIVPMWSVDAAVAEAQRMAKLGAKGITFAFPQQFGYPHIGDKYWDRLWAFAQEANLPINFHIGSGGQMGITIPPSEHIRWNDLGTRPIAANTQIMAVILFSGILERFPTLKIVSSESGIGWVPYLLELADHHWERVRLYKEGMVIKPSDYFHRQCYVNFWFEMNGLEEPNMKATGIDNIMWECDYPHPTSTYPTSQAYIERGLGKLSPELRQKFLVDNAVKVFNLDKYQD